MIVLSPISIKIQSDFPVSRIVTSSEMFEGSKEVTERLLIDCLRLQADKVVKLVQTINEKHNFNND